MKNQNANPSVHIPGINPRTLKEVTPSKCMRYLSLFFDPQLNFHKHAKIATSKASKAAEALHMLGNSTSGINQYCLRQFYLGSILPIITYGSITFWDSKSTIVKNTLERAQNKALCLITGTFKTTPIPALEIEASIPPIDITLDYYTECYATHTQKLDQSNLVMCCIPDHHRENIPPPSKKLGISILNQTTTRKSQEDYVISTHLNVKAHHTQHGMDPSPGGNTMEMFRI